MGHVSHIILYSFDACIISASPNSGVDIHESAYAGMRFVSGTFLKI